MSPDPPIDPIENCLSCTHDIGVDLHSSDDSDDEPEIHAYDGYSLLGQQDSVGGPVNEEEDDLTFETNSVLENGLTNQRSSQNQVEYTAPVPAGGAELVALWNMPANTPSSVITMDDARSAQIRAAMAGFSLPASSVPDWASNIPEEQWKQRLLDRLKQSGQTSLSPFRVL